jgi:hypothetical protein
VTWLPGVGATGPGVVIDSRSKPNVTDGFKFTCSNTTMMTEHRSTDAFARADAIDPTPEGDR